MKPVTPQPVRDSIHPDSPKAHLSPPLLLNLSNPSSKFRVFSPQCWCCQDTSSSWNERRQEKFYLCLKGGKKHWLSVYFTNTEPDTLRDTLGKKQLQNFPGHGEAERKRGETALWARPVPRHAERAALSPPLRAVLRWGWAQPPTPAITLH